MKLVAALCVYNEVQFIAETLDALIQIQDFDQIHIKDGAWKGGAKREGTRSTDGTIERINQWRMQHRERPVHYSWVEEIHATESRKRNAQLAEIEKLHGPDTVVFVIDGDELVRFHSGLTEIWLKDDLEDGVGMIQTYAWNEEKVLWNPRFIPLGRGIHYHTEMPMVIHNGDCNLIADYHPQKSRTDIGRTYAYERLFLVNQWPKRPKERMEEKAEYCHQIEAINPDTPCQFNK